MKYGDFSTLAENYDKFRPSYSNKIPHILLKYFTKKEQIEARRARQRKYYYRNRDIILNKKIKKYWANKYK